MTSNSLGNLQKPCKCNNLHLLLDLVQSDKINIWTDIGSKKIAGLVIKICEKVSVSISL